jgi:hypothetical protein
VNLAPKNIPRRSRVLITTQRTHGPSLLTAHLCPPHPVPRAGQSTSRAVGPSSAPPTPRAPPLGRSSTHSCRQEFLEVLTVSFFFFPTQEEEEGTTRWDPASRAPRILPRSLSLRRGERPQPLAVSCFRPAPEIRTVSSIFSCFCVGRRRIACPFPSRADSGPPFCLPFARDSFVACGEVWVRAGVAVSLAE